MKHTCSLLVAIACCSPLLAHADEFCVRNVDKITWYYSVRAKDGSNSFNYVLQSGESHRFSVAEPANYFVCASKGPMTSDCPQRGQLIYLPKCPP